MKKDSIGAGMGPGAGGQYGRGGSKPGGAGARSTVKVTDKRSAASSSQSTVSGKSQIKTSLQAANQRSMNRSGGISTGRANAGAEGPKPKASTSGTKSKQYTTVTTPSRAKTLTLGKPITGFNSKAAAKPKVSGKGKAGLVAAGLGVAGLVIAANARDKSQPTKKPVPTATNQYKMKKPIKGVITYKSGKAPTYKRKG
jgi:hypothetical protein